MGLTCLELCQAALQEKGITPPSSIESATSMSEIQLRQVLYSVHRYLRRMRTWPQQKKVYTFSTIAGRSFYPLPADFYAMSGETHYDQTARERIENAVSDSSVNSRLYEYELTGSPYGFRCIGPDFNPRASTQGGQFQVVPPPASSGIKISFEYITSTMFLPRAWQALTAYSTSGERINSNGFIYTHNTNGTTGEIAPHWYIDGSGVSVAKDNTVDWAFVPAHAAAAAQYNVGDYVSANSKVYKCTVGGVSSVTPPSHTSGTATDNTVTWEYVSTPSAWAAGTTYTADTDYVSSNSNFYRCVGTGISGLSANSPNFTATLYKEKGATAAPIWSFIAAGQETIPTTGGDEYLSIFDDDIVIAGIQFRYEDAKGLNWETAYKEYLDSVGPGKTRWHGSYVGSMGGKRRMGPSYSVPRRSWEIE